jgi:hypothetical protein
LEDLFLKTYGQNSLTQEKMIITQRMKSKNLFADVFRSAIRNRMKTLENSFRNA